MTQLTIPKNFGQISALFGNDTSANDELAAGVGSSFAVIGYRGKVWAIKHGGKEHQLMRPDGDGPRSSIEVVIVRSSAAKSKLFYKGGYVEGSNSPPDCWSTNGVTPDAGVQNKQSKTCATCPMNAVGSRVTDAGKQARACSEHRRMAVVPLNDIENEALGGPMLLRCPAASLKELKAYADALNNIGCPYFGAATRIAFDPKEAYPKFVFTPIRALSEEEASQVLALRDDKRTLQLLNEAVEVDTGEAEEDKPAPIQFEQPAPKAAPKAAAPKAQPKVQPKPEPVAEEDDEDEAPQAAAAKPPKSFDAMLDSIL